MCINVYVLNGACAEVVQRKGCLDCAVNVTCCVFRFSAVCPGARVQLVEFSSNSYFQADVLVFSLPRRARRTFSWGAMCHKRAQHPKDCEEAHHLPG